MNPLERDRVYFLGIGGIGMSALARWFRQQGAQVAGYDRTRTPLTEQLEKEGMLIHFEDSVDFIPEDFKNPETLVVYTPAIPRDHRELAWFRSEDFEVQKRSQVLGWISEEYFTVAVAGTHGKTTTSSLVAHLLMQGGKSCIALLGGLPANYQTNYLSQEGEGETILVVEADEFDRSFLRLQPNLAVITSMDADHLDIYEDAQELEDCYYRFAALLPEGSTLLRAEASTKPIELPGLLHLSYGLDSGDRQMANYRSDDFGVLVDYRGGVVVPGIRLGMPGFHNAVNACAAAAVAEQLGVSPDAIAEGLASFRGIYRRFERIITREDLVFIDDYAHHPTEIRALIEAVRGLYPWREITVVFQPHLYSRTRDFMDGFAEVLGLADRVLLLDIYPAREQPLEGITSAVLLEKIQAKHKELVTKQDLIARVQELKPDVLLTVGAGDIDALVQPLKTALEGQTA